MKQVITIILLCVVSQFLFAQQTDTTFTTVTQEEGVMEKQQFIDRYDFMFRTKQPSKWLFTANAAAFINNPELLIGIERKITPAISVQLELGKQRPGTFSLNFREEYLKNRISIEPRWYFNMAKRIREGKSANNMSGNYISVEGNYGWASGKLGSPETSYRLWDRDLAFRFGMQRRVFRYGYFDISTGIGVRQSGVTPKENFSRTTNLYLNSSIGMGFALSSPNKKQEVNNGYCDVLSCFREEHRMFKVNLYNILRVYNFDYIIGDLSAAWEEKIGNSPFSVETSVGIKANYLHRLTETSYLEGNSSTLSGDVQLRYYYSLKKRIAKGKSGNNLSGAYFALDGGVDAYREDASGWFGGFAGITPLINDTKSTSGRISLLWGMQYKIFKHGYVDFQLGAGAVKTLDTNNVNISQSWELGTTSRIGVGYSF